MRTIIFLNNKGGVGKTASVTTIAHMIAEEHGKRVLMIDLDPQMNTTCMFSDVDFIDLFLGIAGGTSSHKHLSVEDLLLDHSLDAHECIQHTEYKNLDIIPSYLTLSEAAERMKADVCTPQQFCLKEHLQTLQNEYDYCIIDTSPSVSIVNINGLVAADTIYVPLRCDGGSLLGAAIVMNIFKTVRTYNPGLEMGGMFFTQWNGRKNVSQVVYDLLSDEFGEYLLPIQIGTSKNIEECSLVQKPLLAYDDGKNKNRVTVDYMEMTEYIMNH